MSGWHVLPPRAMVTSGPELRLRAMSESMALLCAWMSLAPVTIQGQVYETDSWSCTSLPAALARTGPALHLDRIVELALVVWGVGESARVLESGTTGPALCCLLLWVS